MVRQPHVIQCALLGAILESSCYRMEHHATSNKDDNDPDRITDESETVPGYLTDPSRITTSRNSHGNQAALDIEAPAGAVTAAAIALDHLSIAIDLVPRDVLVDVARGKAPGSSSHAALIPVEEDGSFAASIAADFDNDLYIVIQVVDADLPMASVTQTTNGKFTAAVAPVVAATPFVGFDPATASLLAQPTINGTATDTAVSDSPAGTEPWMSYISRRTAPPERPGDVDMTVTVTDTDLQGWVQRFLIYDAVVDNPTCSPTIGTNQRQIETRTTGQEETQFTVSFNVGAPKVVVWIQACIFDATATTLLRQFSARPVRAAGDFQQLFVTHNTFTGDLGGVAGADGHCQSEADDRLRSGTWKALLTDDGVLARDRITIRGELYNLEGPVLLANSSAELWETGVLVPPGTDMYNQQIPGLVWTGVLSDGVTPGGLNCLNWTSTVGTAAGIGDATTVANWFTGAPAAGCAEKRHLYCVSL